MNEEKRVITVTSYKTSKYCNEKHSRISLQGKWLGELGFTFGKNVSVTVESENNNAKLILKLID